jgi:hypothetical protein
MPATDALVTVKPAAGQHVIAGHELVTERHFAPG